MNPCRVSWGSAGAHRPHFANCWFQEFPCICFGPSGSVALNSQVISLVPKIKSNIIQKSIAGPFSMSPGPCHAIPCRHQYSLPTPGLVHAFKSTRAIPAAGTLYVLCLVVYYCFLILLFMSYLTNSCSFFKSHTSDYFPGETATAAAAKSLKHGPNELFSSVQSLSRIRLFATP